MEQKWDFPEFHFSEVPCCTLCTLLVLKVSTCWIDGGGFARVSWGGVGWGGDVNVPCTCTHVGCYGDDVVPGTCTHVGCYGDDVVLGT